MTIQSEGSDPVTRLGFWSALVTAVSAGTFSIAALLEMANAIPVVLGWQIIYASSFVLAVAFVVMMISIHHTTPENRQVWSFTGVSFAILYASNVSIMYIVQLFVYIPRDQRGELSESEAILLSDTFGSFLQAVDGLGYLFMGVAFLAAAPVFTTRGLERWVRWFFVANGLVTVPVFLTYFVDPAYILLAGLWTIAVPVATGLVAINFRRQHRAVTS
ncbi:hypothetical protein [Halostagnicola sp. A-GB9-2]|uniref:hypothetical protein n=1 Tax=Halostagnicola sp. A-GB9-2 TaxID=3048066 RepID=UPI0024BF6428|nr:hypothetical protein [Halostagnicola sp. A-GB9-2]MDJ1431457.1 hypothetical protein [Halostagnicola sp. A-GB9-2]